MRRARLLAATVAALLLPASPALAGDPTMPLSEVQPGMRCTGYTVVRGTEITTFDVEIQDVIDGDATGEGPRLLIRVSGPAVDATGVGPGFSGSPIYCDGRNVGSHLGVAGRVRRRRRAGHADRDDPRDGARRAGREGLQAGPDASWPARSRSPRR